MPTTTYGNHTVSCGVPSRRNVPSAAILGASLTPLAKATPAEEPQSAIPTRLDEASFASPSRLCDNRLRMKTAKRAANGPPARGRRILQMRNDHCRLELPNK